MNRWLCICHLAACVTLALELRSFERRAQKQNAGVSAAKTGGVWFIVGLPRRKLIWINVSARPTAEWLELERCRASQRYLGTRRRSSSANISLRSARRHGSGCQGALACDFVEGVTGLGVNGILS